MILQKFDLQLFAREGSAAPETAVTAMPNGWALNVRWSIRDGRKHYYSAAARRFIR